MTGAFTQTTVPTPDGITTDGGSSLTPILNPTLTGASSTFSSSMQSSISTPIQTPSASGASTPAPNSASPSSLGLGLGLGLGIPLLLALLALFFLLGCYFSRRRNSDQELGWRAYLREMRHREETDSEPRLPAYSALWRRADSIRTVSKAELPANGEHRTDSGARDGSTVPELGGINQNQQAAAVGGKNLGPDNGFGIEVKASSTKP
ncbi:hypothetical protein MMC10_005882 [Thelotrema lepadinum]|nr:hypothetical protein [Thelotrema lepadinum]